MDFETEFKKLTTFKPLKWQNRLYGEYLVSGMTPASVDIPTGLGKTFVMAIWYLALKAGAKLPRRLVYIVDRRAVVDQATTVADDIKARSGDAQLKVSTLRGQHVDNREWLEDPAAPAIIVGTVDMIGSRLLFSGYGVSRNMRPYHAGFLGADTLAVLDESHLVPPFEKLLEAIDIKNGTDLFGPIYEDAREIVPPFKLLSLSATSQRSKGECFRLNEEKGDLDDDILKGRLGAKKSLTLVSTADKNLEKLLAEQAWELSEKGKKANRTIIYCNSRDVAEKTKKEIDKKSKDIETELFVGARRIRERTIAEERLKTLGFLGNDHLSPDKPAFLIATSAGEVGIDLDANHMVCDLVEWERIVQRLGRVNRKGKGDAKIVLLVEPKPTPTKKEQNAIYKKGKGQELKKSDQTQIAAFEKKVENWNSRQEPFNYLPKNESGIDVSPGALRNIKLRSENDTEVQKSIEAATSAHPLYPALTRPLVDAWSMTSLENHTGRPEIWPWLRGWIEDEKPQTTVVWRKYLPVRFAGEDATKKEINEFFEAAPPHLSEKLDTETWRLVGTPKISGWLTARAVSIVESEEMKSNPIIAFALDSDGSVHKSFRLCDLTKNNDDKNEKNRLEMLEKDITGKTLILDTRIGGLKEGLLNSDTGSEEVRTVDDGDIWSVNVGFRIRVIAEDVTLESSERISHIFATRQSSEGEDIERLFITTETTEDSRSTSIHPQLLDEHQSWVEKCARKIANEVDLTNEYAEVLAIAARLHDEGKKALRWQRAFSAKYDDIYAKTKGPFIQARLGGYRHEFGSLPHAEKHESLKRLHPDLKDLVLHLIAAHHGHARPLIETKGCDDAPPSALRQRAQDVATRFARLQKRWGPWGLVWWEVLLRAADQQASRDNELRKDNN